MYYGYVDYTDNYECDGCCDTCSFARQMFCQENQEEEREVEEDE